MTNSAFAQEVSSGKGGDSRTFKMLVANIYNGHLGGNSRKDSLPLARKKFLDEGGYDALLFQETLGKQQRSEGRQYPDHYLSMPKQYKTAWDKKGTNSGKYRASATITRLPTKDSGIGMPGGGHENVVSRLELKSGANGRPPMIVSSSYSVGRENQGGINANNALAKDFNKWASKKAIPLMFGGDINSGDVGQWGLNQENYPLPDNAPTTLNILKKRFQLLQTADERALFEKADGYNYRHTWPSRVKQNRESYQRTEKDPSNKHAGPSSGYWESSKIDHILLSRPFVKWYSINDPKNDDYVGEKLRSRTVVSRNSNGTPIETISDHELTAHNYFYVGPRISIIKDRKSIALTFDSSIPFNDIDRLSKENKNVYVNVDVDADKKEFRFSRNNNRTDTVFQNVSDDNGHPILKTSEISSALNLDNSRVQDALNQRQKELGRLPIDFDEDPNAAFKVAVNCHDPRHLGVKGVEDLCIDDHRSIERIVIQDGVTVAIDEDAALGAPGEPVLLNHGGLRTAGPEDRKDGRWAAWTQGVTDKDGEQVLNSDGQPVFDKVILDQIDRPIVLGPNGGWIEISDPNQPVTVTGPIKDMQPGQSSRQGLTKKGVGTLILGAKNTYTGGTNVEEGELRAGVAGAFVDNTLYRVGGGKLNLNDYDLTISSLSGDGGVIEMGSANLTVKQGKDSQYAGAIAGTGNFTKSGKAQLDLIGTNTFTGQTTVKKGALLINGSIASSSLTTVESGAKLGGNGTVGNTVIADGGTIAPGNSIGELKVNGDLTLKPGSTYEVEINSKSESDRITSHGKVTLGGANIEVQAQQDGDGTYNGYKEGMQYKVVHADDGVEGQLNDVKNEDLAFLEVLPTYDGNNAYLVTRRKTSNSNETAPVDGTDPTAPAGKVRLDGKSDDPIPFASVAETPNQAAVADAIDASGKGHRLYDAVVGQNAEEARAAYDATSGEIHASAKGAMVTDSHFVRDTVMARVRDSFGSTGAVSAPVPTHGSKQERLNTGDSTAWLQPYSSQGSLDGNGQTAKLGHYANGLFLGTDALIGDNWRLGIAGGYRRSDYQVDDRHSSVDVDNYIVSLYGGTEIGALGLRLGVAHTWHLLDSQRAITFPGFGASSNASYGGRTTQFFGEAGYNTGFSPSEP
ncbi:autotransporter outer membrane beta-barrel domain-containing protein [Salinisphaera orenii]|uniref:autotransporter outer membrane beta-barrel domain-containing protein n=1 Tax=Salinisphaera orenii TaxID=856731 RepID=UPI0013A686D7